MVVPAPDSDLRDSYRSAPQSFSSRLYASRLPASRTVTRGRLAETGFVYMGTLSATGSATEEDLPQAETMVQTSILDYTNRWSQESSRRPRFDGSVYSNTSSTSASAAPSTGLGFGAVDTPFDRAALRQHINRRSEGHVRLSLPPPSVVPTLPSSPPLETTIIGPRDPLFPSLPPSPPLSTGDIPPFSPPSIRTRDQQPTDAFSRVLRAAVASISPPASDTPPRSPSPPPPLFDNDNPDGFAFVSTDDAEICPDGSMYVAPPRGGGLSRRRRRSVWDATMSEMCAAVAERKVKKLKIRSVDEPGR
ncbi:hypothetical protein HDV00_004775 [Rhizophlyctis rosea]|nr:hypothetical protein HDV00_004775 [Rhizophlyctis rosea]